jgi:hypothetical protein
MRIFYIIFALITATIGQQIHHSAIWAVMDFFLWPLVWLKWLIFHQVTLTAVKTAFAWFLT